MKFRRLLSHIILILGALLMAFPFLWMIGTSLMTEIETKRYALLPSVLITWWRHSPIASIPQMAICLVAASAVYACVRLLARRELEQRRSRVVAWITLTAGCTVCLWSCWHCLITPLGRSLIANYATAWSKAPFARYFLNTIFVSLAVTGCVLITSVLAGYTFGRLQFKGKTIIFGIFMATMMVPFEVILIPNSLLIQRLGLQNTYPALVLPWAANVFSIFLLKQFFQSVPSDYFDAAQIDGCTHWQFLWRVAVPMVKPALITVAIFAFLGSWNSLLWPLIVTDDAGMRVLQVGLSTFLEEEKSMTHLLMAACVFTTAPIVVLYLILQRWFIEGVAGVGLKG